MDRISRRIIDFLSSFTSTVSAQAEAVWKTVPQPAALPKADESGLAAINDIKMYYEIYNAAGSDPVLLLHGGLGSTLNWGNQVPALIGKHRVIALDSRGHGRSTCSDKPFSYDLMTTDVIALMDHLKLDKVKIVGWSDGGIIGLLLAIQHPERVESVFAFGANYYLSGVNPNVATNPVVAKATAMAAESYAKLSPTPTDYENFFKQIMTMWSTQPDIKPDRLRSIKVPVAIAAGQYEEFILPAHSAELAKLIPGAKLVIIPNVSHMGMFQDAATFNREMIEFVDAN